MSNTTIVADMDIEDSEEETTYQTSRTDTAGLRAGILAAHAAIESATAGRASAALEHEIVAGEWTVCDIVGHLADWNGRTQRGIQHALGGADAGDLTVDDFDALNGKLVAIRRTHGDRWEDVTSDLAASLDVTLALLDGVSAEQLALPAALPWGRMSTLLDAFGVFEFHVAEHQRDLLAGSS